MRNTIRIGLVWLLVAGIGLAGCSMVPPASAPEVAEPPESSAPPRMTTVGMYDSADTAVVRMIDPDSQLITLANIDLNKSYTLSYDGATMIRDKYGSVMSMSQIRPGDVADVYFLKGTKMLASLNLSAEAFLFESVSRYTFDAIKGSAVIGSEDYRLKSSALIISDGREIEVADIVYRDVVTVKGVGRNIFSVVVEKGHGYLRLAGDAYAIGGWIEVGETVIQRITEGMLLTVPEGRAEVRITAKGIDTVRNVSVDRNKETVIDLSDVEIAQAKTGTVVFSVTPATATVYVDGETVDTGTTVTMDYGLHQIVCEATGYDTVTQYIKVSQEMAGVTVTMDESRPETTGDSSGESAAATAIPGVSGNGITGTVSGNSLTTGAYRVYIDAPQNAEVYQDSIYMGISPINFPKIAGSHTITLRREGYVTKSYTIHLDSDNRDVTYSFTDLEKTSENNKPNGVSGNN